MRNIFEEKTSKYSVTVQQLFSQLHDLIFAVVTSAQARLWGGLPSYYVGEKFVRLIPFKDHINIEAAALQNYKVQLSDYKFTPQNMLQICAGQSIPTDVLKVVIAETLL